MGLLKAIVEAVHGEDERIAGRPVTRLTTPLLSTETGTIEVVTTNGFGEYVDGAGDAKLLIGGETILASGRTATTFTGLTRGVVPKLHNDRSIVYDSSMNASALDHVRRGLFVNHAVGEDLNILGRNLGLQRCTGIDQDTWREIIKQLAYRPKQPLDALRAALEAFFGDTTSWVIEEKAIGSPFTIDVYVDRGLASGSPAAVRGRFVVPGSEEQDATSTTTVTVTHATNAANVVGVYLATDAALRGYRDGANNYWYSDGDPTTGTPGTVPGEPATGLVLHGGNPLPSGSEPVIVDYSADEGDYHYLADDTTSTDPSAPVVPKSADAVRQIETDPSFLPNLATPTITDEDDRFAYLSDPLDALRCFLDQVRAAGVQIRLSLKQ